MSSPFLPPSGGSGGWSDVRLQKIPLYKEQIVELLAQGVFISEISDKLDIHGKTIREWKMQDVAFREACADAEAAFMDQVEKEALRRAVTGVEEVVVSQGKVVVYTDPQDNTQKILRQRRYSDSLLMFILKGRRREVYGDQSKVDQTVRMDLTGVKDALHRKLAEAVAPGAAPALPGPAD